MHQEGFALTTVQNVFMGTFPWRDANCFSTHSEGRFNHSALAEKR
jgi:hypothetical protein